jgi:hypothetical protein
VALDADVARLLDTSPQVRKPDILAPFQAELAEYTDQMRNLSRMHPDDAMAWLSSVSARILQMMMTTLDYDGRIPTKFRVERLIPLRDETRFQLQIASRRHSVTQLDWEISGKQAT